MRKQFISILIIVSLVMFGGFSVFYYLSDENKVEDKRPIPKRTRIIENIIEEPKIVQKKSIKVKLDDIFTVEEVPPITQEEIPLSKEQKEKVIQSEIHLQLEKRMDVIYKECKLINTQKGIKSKLQKMQYSDVFLSDMQGNTFYGSNSVKDIHARSILLEEIQKVGKYGGGFIKSTTDNEGTSRYILVKDLELNDLFVGVEIYTRIN